MALSNLLVNVALGTTPRVGTGHHFAMEGTPFGHHFLPLPLICTYFCLHPVSYPGGPWKQLFQDVRASLSWAPDKHPSTLGATLSSYVTEYYTVTLNFWGQCIATIRPAPLIQNESCKSSETPRNYSFVLKAITKKDQWRFRSKERYMKHQEFRCSYVFSCCLVHKKLCFQYLEDLGSKGKYNR